MVLVWCVGGGLMRVVWCCLCVCKWRLWWCVHVVFGVVCACGVCGGALGGASGVLLIRIQIR